jgi:hypothetical protein
MTTVKIDVQVETPAVPDTLRIVEGLTFVRAPTLEPSVGPATVDIADLSNDDLDRVAARWRVQLIERAERRRKERPVTDKSYTRG